MGPRDAEPLVLGVPRAAFRPSPIFLALVALLITCGVLTWHGIGNVRLAVFGFVVTGWVVSLCLHEYAHALVAYRFGDRGVAHRGYLTLNPLKYSHPLLSIALPVVVVLLGGIGLPGGAVWIDHRYIASRVKESLISASGPLTNVILAVVAAWLFARWLRRGETRRWPRVTRGRPHRSRRRPRCEGRPSSRAASPCSSSAPWASP